MDFYSLVTRNFWWKITSVLVATVLWVAVWGGVIEKSREDDLGRGPMATFVYEDVPITFLKRASETNQFLIDPAFARVKVKAKTHILEETDVSSIKVVADLFDRPMTNLFRASLELKLGDGLAAEFVEPREVTVRVVGGKASR